MPKRSLEASDREVLRECLKVRGASERAVHELWNICHKDKKLSRGTFEREVAELLGPWEEVVVWHSFDTYEDKTIDLPLVDLKALLQKQLPVCKPLAVAIQAAQSFGDALTAIFYTDEATAGNVLSADKGRKACLFAVSWRECVHHLKNPNMWLPLAIVQADCLSLIRGGQSAVLGRLLAQNVTNGLHAGVQIDSAVGPILFKQKLKCFFLGDADAIRAVTSTKGSAGVKPCFHCANCVKRDSNLQAFDDWFKEIDASEGFVPASDREIFASVDALQHCRSKADLDMKEKATGITFDPYSLWFSDQRCKMPPSMVLVDFMHSYMANGCCSWEVALLMEQVMAHTEVTLPILKEAVLAADWKALSSAHRTRGYIANLFHERLFGEGLYKGQAHQTNSILFLLRYYVEMMFLPAGDVPQPVAHSFLALCNEVQYIRWLQHRLQLPKAQEVEQLNRLQKKHHQAFGVAYGKSFYKPKHHHRLHLGKSILLLGSLPNCEPLETKHQLYKSGVADFQKSSVKDYPRFSAAVLRRLLQVSMDTLVKTGLPHFCLLDPVVDATMEDKIDFASPAVRCSKSHLAL